MFFLIGLLGLILGSIVFIFLHIASKRSGKYYIAPLVTFLAAVLLTLYGIIIVGGFEGLFGYGMIGLGFLIIAIIGTLLLPAWLRRGGGPKEFTRMDLVSMFLLPFLLIAIIFSLNIFNKDYWISEAGTQPYNDLNMEGYSISTISEGRKMVYIELGEDYQGKTINVDKVSHRGGTTILLDVDEEGKKGEVPFIKIGLDHIKDDLTVKTTGGDVIEE